MNGRDNLGPRAGGLILSLLTAALAGLAWMLPPIPQPPEYHHFADQRACLGLPNCLDTSSNVLFLLAGTAGLCFLSSVPARRRAFIRQAEAIPYALFFSAAILAGPASGFYHLAPDNGRLAWDRAAIALALMSWLAAILGERVSLRAGLWLLPPLILFGLGAVGYWSWSEAAGLGDLRPYALMQVLPMALVPLMLYLYPPRYSNDRDILMVIGLYVLALLGDRGDHPIFTLTGGIISGHTIKHLAAALAIFLVLLHLRRRRILNPGERL